MAIIMKSRAAVLGFVLSLLLATACGGRHEAYAPIAVTSADIEGLSAAVLAVPADAPRGELKLVTLGVARVTPPSSLETAPFHALYVRMFVTNASDVAWVVDEAEQRVDVDFGSSRVGHRASTPTGERPPVVTVAPGTTVSIDLLFPIESAELSRFDAVWTIRMGDRLVNGTVAFQRGVEPNDVSPSYSPLPPPYRVPRGYPTPPSR